MGKLVGFVGRFVEAERFVGCSYNIYSQYYFTLQRRSKHLQKLTYRRFLVVGLLVQVIGVQLGHLPELLWLILVQFQGLPVERMLDGILLELVVRTEGVEMLQRFGEPAEVVIDLEASAQLRQLL